MRARSRVWDLMEKVGDTEALCLLCSRYFGIHSNSTSNLLKHIQRMHGNEDPDKALIFAQKVRESRAHPAKKARKLEPSQELEQSEKGTSSDLEGVVDEGEDQSASVSYMEVPSPNSLLTPEAANKQLKHLRTWDYMTRVSSSESKCKLCDKMIKYTPCHGTSNMVRHIRRHFTIRNKPGRRPKNTTSNPQPFTLKVENSSMVKLKTLDVVKQRPIHQLFGSKVGSADKKGPLNKLVLNMLTQDLQPFSVLKDPGFVNLLKGMDPSYSIPSKSYIMNVMLPHMCEETKVKILRELRAASSVSIGAEVWTHNGLQTLLSISCHFISSRWEFCSVMLDAIYLEEEYSSNTIANELYKVFEAWELTSKVFCITTDASADMAAAVAQLHINHQVCYARTLNILVNQAFSNVEGFSLLKEKVVDVVKYFLRNLPARDYLNKLQKDDGKVPKNLKPEVKTRWTSVFYMFQRYIELHDYVTKTLDLKKSSLVICEENLETMKECVQAIEPFEIVAKDLSANNFTSLSKVLPTTRTLTKYLGNLSSALSTELLAQLVQCFPQLEADMFPLAATYLDPRFRELSFEEPDTCTRVQDELRSMMDKESFQAGLVEEEELTKASSSASLALWSEFDQRVQSTQASAKVKPPTLTDMEFGRYDCEALILRHVNPLPWWNSKEKVYPALCLLARQFLSVPATCIAPSRLFTKEGQLMESKRNGIPVSSVGQVLFLHHNIAGSQHRFT